VNIKKKLPLLVILIALLVGGACYWNFRGKAESEEILVLFGNVDIRKVDLGFRVGGQVAEVAFEEGGAGAPGRRSLSG